MTTPRSELTTPSATAIRANSENYYQSGIKLFEQAKQTANKAHYQTAVTDVRTAYELLLTVDDADQLPRDKQRILVYVKTLIDCYLVYGNFLALQGEYISASQNLNVGTKFYNDCLENNIMLNVSEAELMRWQSYQKFFIKLLKNNSSLSEEKSTNENTYGEYEGEIYTFNQIPNDGIAETNRNNNCGFISIGVTAEDMRALIADAKEEDFAKISELIRDQIINDYFSESQAEGKNVNIDDQYYAELKRLITRYNADAKEKADAVANYSMAYSEALSSQDHTTESILAELTHFQISLSMHDNLFSGELPYVEEIAYIASIQAKAAASSQAYMQFAERADVIKNYLLNETEAGYIGCYMLLAWAKLAGRSLQIWDETEVDCLHSLRGMRYDSGNSDEMIHIVHTHNKTHFERLKLLTKYTVQYADNINRHVLENQLARLRVYVESLKDVAKSTDLDFLQRELKRLIAFIKNNSLLHKPVDLITLRISEAMSSLVQYRKEIASGLAAQLIGQRGLSSIDIYWQIFSDVPDANQFHIIFLNMMRETLTNLILNQSAVNINEFTQLSFLHAESFIALQSTTEGAARQIVLEISALFRDFRALMLDNVGLTQNAEVHSARHEASEFEGDRVDVSSSGSMTSHEHPSSPGYIPSFSFFPPPADAESLGEEESRPSALSSNRFF
jgi:hypothetical protein